MDATNCDCRCLNFTRLHHWRHLWDAQAKSLALYLALDVLQLRAI